MSAASKPADQPATFEVVLLTKLSGPLSKRIFLDASGRVISDGSACVMSVGEARRAKVTPEEFAELITGLNSAQAIALGALRDDLPDTVRVETKAKLQQMNGVARPDIIARTSDFIIYRPDRPALLLFDDDQKGMPASVRKRIDEAGGFQAALHSVLPQLAGVCSVLRASTSAGLYREDTGERFQGSGGLHKYIGIADGSDAERALRVADARCWLAGYGWMMIGKGGALLKRSIVDRMVGGAERISFEGAPDLASPLGQDSRPAEVSPGGLLDTRTACPELTLMERTKLGDLERAATYRLKPEAEKARAKFVQEQATVITARTGGTTEAAQYIVERQCRGVLLPPVTLAFVAEELAGSTVADVLADPKRFEGATLADPVEGVEYGRGKAKVLLRDDGTPRISSFAHGRTFFSLRYDAAAIEAAIIKAGADRAAPDITVRMLANAEVNKADEDRLIGIAAKRSKVSKTAIRAHLKDLRTAAAKGGRPQPAPTPSLPEIVVKPGLRHEAADAGIVAMHAANAPFYQRAGGLVRVSSTVAKASDGKETHVPSIVPVTTPILGRALSTSANWKRLDELGNLNTVDCPWAVVEEIGAMAGHWPFPALAGVIGTPTLRMDGSLLCAPGYDTATGLYLHEPPPMPPIPPRPTRQEAMTALEVLNSLLTDFPFVGLVSRSVALSMLMTPVLRGALGSAVPAHVLSAPAPGTGKSYLGDTASAIAIGERCPVISVAPKEEETEKRLIAAALAGHPIISIDNCNGVLTGDFLCQVTERPIMELRALGSSKLFRISNTFTCFANGNNIIIAGDMTRRVVRCLLDANVEDPLTRTFSSNPVKTVLADRGRYIAAILTIARACIAAKYPCTPHLVPSYERWSGLVCGGLIWLDLPNPADSMAKIREEDPSGGALATVLMAWPECYLTGASTAQLVEAASAYNYEKAAPTHPGWLDAISPVAKNKIGHLDAFTFSMWLGSNRDRMVGRRKLRRAGTPTRPLWMIGTDAS
jgi:putative DNA primase/helicase